MPVSPGLSGSSVSAPRRKISVPAERLIERGVPIEMLIVGSIFSNKKKFGQSWAILGNLGQSWAILGKAIFLFNPFYL